MVGLDGTGSSTDGLARLPAALRASVERHQRNLADLTVKLQSAGMPAEVIAGTVRQLVASYENELVAALAALARETVDA